jgi:hypothetical protein
MSTRVSKQIGWSQESNLLYEILRKLGELAGIASKVKPYKVYSALLSDNGVGVDVIVLENTLGSDILWTLQASYEYRADLIGAFVTGKTVFYTQNNNISANTPFIATVESEDTLKVYTNGVIAYNLPVEIRVYN